MDVATDSIGMRQTAMLQRDCMRELSAVTIWQMPSSRLEVYIQPRASKSEVAGMHDGVIKIRIAAPAVDNAANLALAEFVADQLGIAKRSVRIVSGGASRRKVLEIDGVTGEEIAERFKRGNA
jgi:uncharacterized protein (TIGR00251 family)